MHTVGMASIVQCLVDGGACPTVFTSKRILPIHFAAAGPVQDQSESNGLPARASRAREEGAMECIRALLAAKSPLHATDASGQGVLHYAARAGTTYVIEGLLASEHFKLTKGVPAGIESRDRWQRTPLHWACLNGHVDAVRSLLSHGANPQPKMAPKRVRKRRTHLQHEAPLHIACRSGHRASVDIAGLLINARVDINDKHTDSEVAPIIVLYTSVSSRIASGTFLPDELEIATSKASLLLNAARNSSTPQETLSQWSVDLKRILADESGADGQELQVLQQHILAGCEQVALPTDPQPQNTSGSAAGNNVNTTAAV